MHVDDTARQRLAELTEIEATWLRRTAPLAAGDRLLWIGIATTPGEAPPGALQASFIMGADGNFSGDARGSGDALPFVPGSASHVVVQHAHEVSIDGDDLLCQCAELLKPAGVLLVFGFHPWSMWQRQIQGELSLRVRTPQSWARSLQAQGLDVLRVERVGPAWPGAPGLFDRFGMAYALRASRSGAAIIPFRGRVHAGATREFSLATRAAASLRRSA